MIEKVSIVVPTFNEEKYLPKLLDSIAKQGEYKNLQIVVIDGQSDDQTVKVTKDFQEKIEDLSIISSRRGIGYQRNLGVKRAKHDHILFLDADTILPDHFFKKLLPKIDPNEQFVAFFNFRIAEYDPSSYLIFWAVYPFILAIILYYKLTPGFALLTTRSNHNAIGGFRENIQLAEDHDYGQRSIAKGAKYKLIMSPVVLYSIRRAKKMGTVNFLIFHLKLFLYMRKYGLSSLGKHFKYPFGNY